MGEVPRAAAADQSPGDEVPGNRPRLRLEYRTAAELASHPSNWRRHPAGQLQAIKASTDAVGWAGALLYNERTARLLDGHARKKLAGRDELVPVLIGSWTEDEERIILATLDPLAALAEIDRPALEGLIAQTDAPPGALQDLLDSLAPPAREPVVREVATDPVLDRFWIAIRGPLEHQAVVLQRMREATRDLEGVAVELGTIDLEAL